MTKGELLACLQKLNKHYKRMVRDEARLKELGVSQRTISNWLSTNGCDGKEAIIAKMGNVSNNCLSVRTIPHYLVVCQTTR